MPERTLATDMLLSTQTPARLSLGFIVCLSACGNSACGNTDDGDLDTSGGTQGSGAGATAGTTASGTGGSGTGIAPAVWQVGFVPETEPGSGPAALAFANESTAIISGVIQETSFWQIAPGATESWVVARSADVQADATIGFHESFAPEAPCAFLPVVVSGVSELTPGEGYLFRVFDEGDSYSAEIVADATPDFVGLRAYLGSPLPPSSTVTLTFDGQSEPMVLDLLQFDASIYGSVAESSVEISAVTLDSSAGESWQTEMSTTLQGAPGYTIYVGTSPPPDAENVAALEPVR